ncbi:tyrosine-type recombinase/integrase [Streptomyces resistomycificus]|uniref:tyrosine-type recombinase/integrase n=1 Tax=Streptomyces resistomycificus TaxID=67356 RepID=UPI00056ADC36|nr:tyrosine-type recombinase/integrase [Streptomyces resistomycificus]KUN93989.1 integrase [Streptomyces resistomycificus]
MTAAHRLAEAEDLADAVAREITPANTQDTYAKSWRVWERFTTAQGFPRNEGTRGSLVAFVMWMLREGQQNDNGYAPSSASTILAGVVVGLRERGCAVNREDQAAARKSLDGLAVRLLQEGERRGRGQAAAAEVPDLYRVVRVCPDTLAGARDKALILTGFYYASRAQDPAGLLAGDVALTPRGMVVSVLTGKTKHSVRDAKINYQDDPEICPVEAWKVYRARLAAEAPPPWSEPTAPAFVGIDRHGNVTGGMVPDSVTRAVKRISGRAGVHLAWTGHSLRIGLATTARKRGKDAVTIADQGGWARHSRSMNGYFQRVDGWEDNATAGLI